MPPPGSERTSVMRFDPVITPAIGAPGVVLPSETLVHGRQPCTALPDVVKTPPEGSARNSATRSVPVTRAAIGAPGVVLPSETLVHGRHPWSALPDVVNTP